MAFSWNREQKQTDAQLFEELAVPLLGQLYNFARWQTRDHHEAEDLVQETFARALKGFHSFQQGTNFRAWIYRILRNTFLSSRTGLAQHVAIEDEDGESLLPPERETPESLLLNSNMQQQLQAALERIPIVYREAILLCDVEEMKYQEIAEVLDLPIGTVMSRIARARKMLRGMLAEERLRGRR
jgi:RNA polymerase sigma-70 factor, ECF subfamily